MASLTCTIEPDEFRGLSALVELERAAAGGNASSGAEANAVSRAKVLMRTALADELAEAGLPWAPSAEAVKNRAAEAAEPPGTMRRIMRTDAARKSAACVIAAVLVAVLWGGYIGGWHWTGFQDNNQVWDWLKLLLLPVVLGTIPVWIQAKDYIDKDRRTIYAVVIVAWTGFVIAGYLIPLNWTGFPGVTLWKWLGLLVVPAAVVAATTLMSRQGRRPKAQLRPYHKAIIAAGAAAWIVTVIGGYALGWKWTGYAGKDFWNWLNHFLPLVFPVVLLPPLLGWVSGNAAERASAAHEAAVAPTAGSAAGPARTAQESAVARTAGGGAAGAHESDSRQGLWSVPGNGVLARQGDLILLSAIDERGLVDNLLETLTQTSQSGGDGRPLADAVEDLVESDETWGGGQDARPGPAVIALGPVRAGLEIMVSGSAWAEITTVNGTERLVAGQPATVLRSVVGVPVHAVHGGLGTGRGAGDHTDLFSRLERGSVRAGGLSYHCGLPPAPPPGGAAPGAVVPPVPNDAGPDGASPDAPAGADAAAPDPMAGQANEASQGHGPAEPPPVQLDAVEPHATEPEMAEPATVDFGTAEPEAGEPEAGEPAVPPQADPLHPATAKVQVPDLETTPHAAPSDAAPAAHEATGPAGAPPLPSDGAPRDGTGAAAEPPTVLGVYCRNGHFGDPEACSCAVCGVSRNRQDSTPQPGPRPSLGVLLLDDDETLELSTDYVIGRHPTRDASVAAGQARPIFTTDVNVSRIHARVHLDGWHVFLTDLGSANGTRIRPPGKDSDQALEPNVPVPLQSGTRIFVGTHNLWYEYHPGR